MARDHKSRRLRFHRRFLSQRTSAIPGFALSSTSSPPIASSASSVSFPASPWRGDSRSPVCNYEPGNDFLSIFNSLLSIFSPISNRNKITNRNAANPLKTNGRGLSESQQKYVFLPKKNRYQLPERFSEAPGKTAQPPRWVRGQRAAIHELALIPLSWRRVRNHRSSSEVSASSPEARNLHGDRPEVRRCARSRES